jgi:hypothetical protein
MKGLIRNKIPERGCGVDILRVTPKGLVIQSAPADSEDS